MSENTAKNSVFFGGWRLPPDTGREEVSSRQGSTKADGKGQIAAEKWKSRAPLISKVYVPSLVPSPPQYLFGSLSSQIVNVDKVSLNPFQHRVLSPRQELSLCWQLTPTAQDLSLTPRSQEATI